MAQPLLTEEEIADYGAAEVTAPGRLVDRTGQVASLTLRQNVQGEDGRSAGGSNRSIKLRRRTMICAAEAHGRSAVAGSFGRMDHPRHDADLYETPAEAIDMLLRHVPVSGPVLEPSAGRGAIVRELRRHGLKVHASDLYDHKADPRLGIKTGVDFLKATTLFGCRSGVMNPPFKDAERHVRHALRLLPDGGTLAVLLRMNWRAAKGRADLLPYIHTEVIAGRLKMLPPGAIDRGHGGTTDFSWFVFGRQAVKGSRIIRA